MPRPSRKRLKFAVFLVGGVLILGGVGEIALRATGFRPWNPRGARALVTIEPNGTITQAHPRLGYALLPGRFTIHQGNFSWQVTNVTPMNRASRPQTEQPPAGRPAVWIFGDSFTYGWGDDSKTYPWKLQAARHDLEVTNFGVGGYSTLQSLIQLEESLAAGGHPRLVVLSYASFHDSRSSLLRNNRKYLVANPAKLTAMPRAWLEDGVLKTELAPLHFQEWPLMRVSALVNFVDEKYCKLQILTHRASDVTRAIIREIHDKAKAAGSDFLLVGIFDNSRTAAMLSWARGEGMRALDISVDLSDPRYRVPADGHPNDVAAQIFADRIAAELPAATALR
jgi:lysophospholipase L1-like esterase